MNKNDMVFGAIMVAMLLVGALLSYVVLSEPGPPGDQDGDGFPDVTDAFPDDPREWSDSDGDGVGDNSDHAPFADRDGDGYPDNEDAFPDDLLEWRDADGNGVGDNSEFYPLDSDDDGFTDNVDLYPGGDMGIFLNITRIEVHDRVDLFLDEHAEVYLSLRIDGVDKGRMDDGGEPWSVPVGSMVLVSESYRFNVDDSRRYTNFEVTMFDDDLASSDVMDIDGASRDGRTLNVTYDAITMTWRGNDVNGVADGSLDGTSDTDDDDGAVHFSLGLAAIEENRTYQWSFHGRTYTMMTTVPPRAYAEYGRMDVPRSYYYGFTDEEMRRFVTSEDPIVMAIAAELRNMSASAGFDEKDTVNFALRFCQSMQYSYDNATMDADEYWRFPVETL
ncbi:MAG: hypothetical protein ISF22_03550, partial [Methanomassiliicoccus sp.]|nr:hypothetical protein [Methanomassiliicoccus sp.]